MHTKPLKRITSRIWHGMDAVNLAFGFGYFTILLIVGFTIYGMVHG